MAKHPVKATDRRRTVRKSKGVKSPESGSGSSHPLADLFNDRRGKNGRGKRSM